MSRFVLHTPDTAPAASRPNLEALAEQLGFIPNLAATIAGAPTLLEAFGTLRSLTGQGSLDPVALQLIEVATAIEQRCTYCVAAHSTFALKLGADPAHVEAVRQGRPPADARLAALTALARRLARHQAVEPGELEALDRAGFSQAQILEALVAVTLPTLAGYVHHLAAPPVDAAFQPQAWEPPARTAEGGAR